MTTHQRLLWLDRIRAVTFFSMALYHAVWDGVYLFGADADWYKGAAGYVWQQSICWTFILLSGFCCLLGRHQFKRGLQVFFAGVLVSAVTQFIMPESRIIFGILTFLGSAALLALPADKLFRRARPAAGLIVNAVLFALTKRINYGYLGWKGLPLLKLPPGLYRGWLTAYIGFPAKDFASTDYYSLLPWLFLFFCGMFLNRLCQPRLDKLPPAKRKLPVLDWTGRHTLLLYLLHQPVIFGIMLLITRIFASA